MDPVPAQMNWIQDGVVKNSFSHTLRSWHTLNKHINHSAENVVNDRDLFENVFSFKVRGEDRS